MNTKKIMSLFSLIALISLTSCYDDEFSIGEVVAPTNIQIDAEIEGASEDFPFGDGSGFVDFTVTADNAINFSFDFGDGATQRQSSGQHRHRYTRNGVNDYLVTVTASGTGGAKSVSTIEISVESQFDDPETFEFLTGGEGQSKTWSIARNEPGHLGVGPLDSFSPDFFAAAPNQLAQCLYDDEITLSAGPNNTISFEHDNVDPDGVGVTFFNGEFNTIGGGGGPDDQCLPFDVSGQKNVSLAPAGFGTPEDVTTGTEFTIGDDGFMAYYINTSTYEILEITDDFLYVRALSGSASNQLAWYLKFTTDAEGEQDNTLETQFEDLVWSDEFDVDGMPDSSIWNFEIGNGADQGIPGWGNQELQYYTDENAIVDDGKLVINLVAEPTFGFDYSSARLNTLNNFGFQYGRIEVRAKLPEGGGTWPAIWMMGTNFPDIGWPECGEIDIMEHSGNAQDEIHGTVHFPGNFGGNAIGQTTVQEDVSNEFNNYTVEWDENQIQWAINDQVFFTFQNNGDLPFNNDFFILLNVAMGGTFVGNTVDPNFEESAMEIEYVRVFQ